MQQVCTDKDQVRTYRRETSCTNTRQVPCTDKRQFLADKYQRNNWRSRCANGS